nr:hypothetical protein [Bradyrhizobium diazoefficiens]
MTDRGQKMTPKDEASAAKAKRRAHARRFRLDDARLKLGHNDPN